MMSREFTDEELRIINSYFPDYSAVQNMSYGICVKDKHHVVEWLTFDDAEEYLYQHSLSAIKNALTSKIDP